MRKYDNLFQPNGVFEEMINNSQLVQDIVDKLEEEIPEKYLAYPRMGMNNLAYTGIETWLELHLSSAILHELWVRRQKNDNN